MSSTCSSEIGIHLPSAFVNAPVGKGPEHTLVATGAIVNMPAVLIVLALTWICYIGIRQSARLNNIMVVIKVAIIVLFIVAGISLYRHGELAALHAGERGQVGRLRLVSGLLRVRRSSSSPTSVSTRPRPPHRRRAIRSATCRSASSPR